MLLAPIDGSSLRLAPHEPSRGRRTCLLCRLSSRSARWQKLSRLLQGLVSRKTSDGSSGAPLAFFRLTWLRERFLIRCQPNHKQCHPGPAEVCSSSSASFNNLETLRRMIAPASWQDGDRVRRRWSCARFGGRPLRTHKSRRRRLCFEGMHSYRFLDLSREFEPREQQRDMARERRN